MSSTVAADPSAEGGSQRHNPHHKGFALDPVLMMLAAMAVAILMTWVIPSGQHRRAGASENAPVIAGTYHQVPKAVDTRALLPGEAAPGTARPVSPLAIATSIPRGLVKAAPLITMILLLGGMFGILRASGALDAGIKRLVGASRGNAALLTPVLMIALSAGSTFLGMVTEYLLLIPIIMALGRDLGRSPMFGFALVALSAKVGYLASVTNPFALIIAQPIAGVPVFSGLALRLAIWVVFLSIAVVAVLRTGRNAGVPVIASHEPLSARHAAILGVAGAMLILLVTGSVRWGWDDAQFGAVFALAGALMAAIARMTPARAVQVFVSGMETMMLAALLVGLGRSVELILRDGQVLDTVIEALSSGIRGLSPLLVAPIIMLVEMVLTLLIPSTSAKAALSIPILAPVAATAGVSGQTTVLAFLLGNGLVNMISPTSGMLLAYLATAGIPYGAWFRYVLPIFSLFAVLAVVATVVAVATGY